MGFGGGGTETTVPPVGGSGGPGGGAGWIPGEDSRIGGIPGVLRPNGRQPLHLLQARAFSGGWGPSEVPTSPVGGSVGSEHVVSFIPHWPTYEWRMSPKRSTGQRRGWMTHQQLILDIQLNTSSGSNTWHCTVEFLRNVGENKHAWDLYPCPRGSNWLRPRYFTEADLPIQNRLILDRKTCCGNIALRFKRYGAGTNTLYIRRIATMGGM